MAGSVKKFTMAEVKEHNTSTDLWTVIHDKVYDVTKFQNEHPGGEEVLLEAAGKNSTRDFDDADHSASAIEQMATYYIGDIVDEERKEKPSTSSASSASGTSNSKPKYCLAAVSAIAVAIGAIVLYKGYKLLKSSN